MRIAVIGAGHGGQALAGYLAHKGAEVVLFNRTPEVIENIKNRGGITIEGCVEALLTKVELTWDIGTAVRESEVIMVCVPSNNHQDIASAIKPYLSNGQIIVLNPGRTMGAYLFADFIDARDKGVIVAETDTFLLTARKLEDGVSKIFSLKKQVCIAAMDQKDTRIVCNKLRDYLSVLKDVDSLSYTSMSNIGVIFHPLPALLNIARIECEESFLHYKEGISPAVAVLLEKLDEERVGLSRLLGTPVLSAMEWVKSVYGSEGDTLYEVIQNTDAYNEVIAPKQISTRYIFEDISTGIVPMYCMLEELGGSNSTMELVIRLAQKLYSYDFIGNGRSQVKGFLDYINHNKEK